MASAPQIDLRALLEAFFLKHYVQIFGDQSRSADERIAWQMELEAFILSGGVSMLRQISTPLAVIQLSDDTFAAVSWYTDFASSLKQEWLEQVDADLLARAWIQYSQHTFRRHALELIAKKEWIVDRNGNSAKTSRIVELYNQVQPDRNAESLSTDATVLLGILLRRASFTHPTSLAGGSLGNYCVQVARFCFDMSSTSIGEDDINTLLALCPEFEPTTRDVVANRLRLTKNQGY